jgi:hypothetical protein
VAIGAELPIASSLLDEYSPKKNRGFLLGPVGRIRDALLRRKLTGTVDKAMVDPVNIIRAQLGIPPLTSADDYAGRLGLVLVATAQPSDYPHPDWDDSIQLIGACCYDPASSTVPRWLVQIVRPIVLVSTSSEN